MPKMPPPHPGDGLRDDIEALGLSVTQAALALGISRQQLNNILAGRSSVSADVAVRLEQAIGSTADHWLRLQAAYDLSEARERNANLKLRRVEPKVA